MIGCSPKDRVIDIACGTGGFLVSAYDRMMDAARNERSGSRVVNKIKNSICGFDTNPTVWALAMLNMFFRGDGKSNIKPGSCFEPRHKTEVREKSTRAFLNPPFSQEGEPERDFIDAALDALEPGGKLAVVVYAGIFADDAHKNWRKEMCRRHTVTGLISLPEDLFYPTAAPTSILLADAHEPQTDASRVLMARIWNDGFEKLKNRRVERPGSELQVVLDAYTRMLEGHDILVPQATSIRGHKIMNGEEWSPQQWLPQPVLGGPEIERVKRKAMQSIFRAVTSFPELADSVLGDFGTAWTDKPELPLDQEAAVEDFFQVMNGKSVGENGECQQI